jgi:hypothetical protein
MKLDTNRTHKHLKDFDFKKLFVEELGWNHYNKHLEIPLDSHNFTLSAIAEKKGMAAFTCSPSADGRIPDYAARRKIEKEIAKSIHEHIIIYVDNDRTTQIWQWVRRETGKPTACREHTYHKDQTGDSLIQKLENIAFSLEEEETLTTPKVAGRMRKAFDVERVTKRFYDRFKKEHDSFFNFIMGIPDDDLHRWYASVMLNRLMFIYFIQKKGFLDSDTDYLRNKLLQSKQQGKDIFYKGVLCPLFFEGFAKKERSATIKKILGEVPYLNGGLFLKHQIEELHGRDIQISDNAFEKLFDFFDQYQWHLDERPLRKDDEINPDVLGYIFEKYINQKQMGAYYTKEDITEYISKNTVIPFLFDVAREKCKIAFEGESSVWGLLKSDPDRYIYNAVKHGITVNIHTNPPERLKDPLPLPHEIEAGIKDVSKRTEWNKPAPREYALPTEIWREVVARRQRYEEVKSKMLNGDIQSINDLITYNLDIRQFAQDVIENSEGPELLRAFYHAIEDVTVLDPTCGSGAFLFAALNILEPLYEACLNRMQVFLDELELSDKKHRADKYGDFRKILNKAKKHPNLKYFIFKSIIIKNLYGVDIMEEAIEICKLRLFLKLVSQIEKIEHIEPLPDIDFNIRAGNTLVGFATFDEVEKAVTSKLDFDNTMERIKEQAEDIDRLFQLFHQQQTELGGEVAPEDKQELKDKLKVLEDKLNQYLAGEYGIDPAPSRHSSAGGNPDPYDKWLKSHHPFHWFIEFYGILNSGGFDVIIGNPPYVEIAAITKEYALKGLSLAVTGNLYSVCVERFASLLEGNGHCGVIMPISSVSTPRMFPLMKYMIDNFLTLHLSNFAVRPGKLFVGVDMNLTIMIGGKREKHSNKNLWSTRYIRWQEDYRPILFNNLIYATSKLNDISKSICKLGIQAEVSLIDKLMVLPHITRYPNNIPDADVVYYHSGGRYFRKCIREKLSNEYKELTVEPGVGDEVICVLSSSFYYWLWIVFSDCFHVTKRDIDIVPFPDSIAKDSSWKKLSNALIHDLYNNAETRIRNRADGTKQKEINFRVGNSKPIIDEIDRVLAKHYGFTDEELDFIINYDIKYRMGLNNQKED